MNFQPVKTAQKTLIFTFMAFPISIAMANIGSAMTLIFFALGLVEKNNREKFLATCASPLAKASLLIVAISMIGLLWSPITTIGWADFFRKETKFLFIPVFLTLLLDQPTRKRCWLAFSAAMLIALMSTWTSVWVDLPWSKTHNLGFGVDHSVFSDYIAQGIMMTFFSAYAAYSAFKSNDKNKKAMYWLIFILAVTSILFLLQGRTGYIALIISTVVFFSSRSVNKRPLVIGAIITIIFILILIFSSHMFTHMQQGWNEAVNYKSSEITSIGSRMKIWQFAIQNIIDNPILGSGTGSYQILAAKHFDKDLCAVVCLHPHNQFLYFSMELGVVGLMAFLLFIYSILRQSFMVDKNSRALMLSFVAIMVVSCMTHSSFWLIRESQFYIFISALLMACAMPKAQK